MQEVEADSGTVQNAASRIMSLMDGKPPEEDATHPEQEAQSLEQPEPVEQVEEPELAAQEESEPTDEEPVTLFTELADHLGVEEDFLENLIVPTKVNGEERQATIKDLIAHYQKGESADLKLMDLSEQRKKFETETSQLKEQLNQEWGRIQALNQELQNMLSGDDARDLEALRYSDPAEYAARVADRQQRLTRAEHLRQQMTQEQAKKINENYQRTVETEKRRLLQALPEWQDDKTATKENAMVRNYLKDQGFQDWEIDGKIENGVIAHTGVVDHRAIVIARKAMLYDQSKSGSQPKKAKLKSLPKVGAGKRISKEDVSMEQKKSVRERVRKSGTIDDAALAIRQIMEN